MNDFSLWHDFLECIAQQFKFTGTRNEVFFLRFSYSNLDLRINQILDLPEVYLTRDTFVHHLTHIYRAFTNSSAGYPELSNHQQPFQPLKQWLLNVRYSQWLRTYSSSNCDPYQIKRAAEYLCFQELLLQDNAFVRVKAPRGFGKTTLMNQVLSALANRGCRTVRFDLSALDPEVFANYTRFCQCFCVGITQKLKLPEAISDYWMELLGANQNTTWYFEEYLLPTIAQPLILGLDGLDSVFEQDIATGFCSLLRGWHENQAGVWQNLNLIISHNTDVYSGMSINSSPLAGIGRVIPLAPFSVEEVQTLAQNYELNLNSDQVTELMVLLGGHPYLVNLACEHLRSRDYNAKLSATWQEFLKLASTDEGIYRNHLLELIGILNQNPQLATAFAQVIQATEPISLAANIGFKLVSLGLVRVEGNSYTPQCKLYQQYMLCHLEELKQ